MKRLSFAVLSSYLLLLFAACQPEERIVPMGERTIVYTVAEHPADTVHLTSEAEWDALLDRLLDYAEEGNGVTFYNADRAGGKGNRYAASPKEDHTLTTTSRDEMRAWCRQMERLGLTVVIAYDRTTGTWSGTAYATAPPPPPDECYTGVLTAVGVHNMDGGVPMPGLEWALQVGADSVLTLVRGSSFITCIADTLMLGGTPYRLGDTVTLCGNLRLAYEYDYSSFLVLVLDGSTVPHDPWGPLPVYHGYVTFYEGWPNYRERDYTFTLTLDEANRTLYCTSTLANLQWQGRIGGGIFHYEPTGQTDSLGNPILWVYGHDEAYSGSDTASGGIFALVHNADGSLTLRDLNDYPVDGDTHTLGEIHLQRDHPNSWETWVCDTAGYNIVFHLNNEGCVVHSMGYSSMPFYVDCTTPFQIGEFTHSVYGGPVPGAHEAVYTATDTYVYFLVEYPDVRERLLRLTPLDPETSSCTSSYLFRRK